MTDTTEQQAVTVAQETMTRPGYVVWHSSEEDGGPDVGITIGLGDGKMLWVGERSGREGDGMGLLVYGDKSINANASLGEYDEIRDLIEHHVAPALSRLASVSSASAEGHVREAFSGVMRAEVVNGGAWSLHLHFGSGDGARDRMRAASSLLGSIVAAPPTPSATTSREAEWVTVPREPTQDQLIAGNGMFHTGEVPLNIYRAMLAASPEPVPATNQAGEVDYHGVRHLLLNLLATVHRDGGQYVDAHGEFKATEDAVQVVASLLAANPAVAFTQQVASLAGDELDAHASPELRDLALAALATQPATSQEADWESQANRLDRIRDDGGPLTLSDKAVLRETAQLMRSATPPPGCPECGFNTCMCDGSPNNPYDTQPATSQKAEVRPETITRIRECAASDPAVVFDANVWLNKDDAMHILAALAATQPATSPMKMAVDQDWLAAKIAADPDSECDAGVMHPEAPQPATSQEGEA